MKTLVSHFYRATCLHKDDISQAIDINITSESKECDICHYWYFLDKGFKFQLDVCNGCYDVLIMSMNLNDISIINGISKSEAINLPQKADLIENNYGIF